LFIGVLRRCIQKYGKENIVCFDESGFENETIRLNGWASRGKRVKGDVSGAGKRRRTNLIMAQRRGQPYKSYYNRLDQLLRTVLPVSFLSCSRSYRYGNCQLGNTKIQGVTSTTNQGAYMAQRCCTA
jgi:hypothetical protein